MAIQEIDHSNIGNSSSRNGAAIRWWAFHTSEGQNTARDLESWMPRNDVSYHYISDPGVIIDHVNTDRAAWAVLDANPRTINAVFAGSFASWNRDQWMKRAPEIEEYCRIIVEDANKYNPLDPFVIGKDYRAIASGRAGVIDHSGITHGLGIGTHTDCGQFFPFDFAQDRISRLLVPATPPPRNEIDFLRSQPGFEWLGDALTQEVPIPGGVYRQYVGGYVYFSVATGAQPVPNHVFETWAQHGYEAGEIGWPIGYHTVLKDSAGQPVGDVQGFANGAIYRKYGQPGFFIHGNIRARWNRTGFENGIFGWPTTEEYAIGPDARVQNFEGGTISWAPDGVTALRPTDGPDQIIPDTHA